jgi:AbrB family looped-hinge helix DNA binding protein
MKQSTMTSKGQTTIPVEIRRRLGLKPGDQLIYEEQDGEIILRAHPGVKAVAGMLRDDLKQRKADAELERQAAHDQWARDGVRGVDPGAQA